MFQPEVKFEFIRRYCSPEDGWKVMMDIDPSEEGKTGGQCNTPEALTRQEAMIRGGAEVRKKAKRLGIDIVGNRASWFREHGFPRIAGDRDVVAFHPEKKIIIIAEVEGASSGQPEQKLYKAIGQIVLAAGKALPDEWSRQFILVVYGEAIARHLTDASALTKLGLSGIALADHPENDRWAFGEAPQSSESP
jgi:hypothetical protein